MKKLNRIYDYLSLISYYIFLYGICTILPLYFKNDYFDLVEAKNNMHVAIYKVLLPCLVGCLILKFVLKKIKFEPSILIIGLIYFLITSFISTVFCYSPKDAFTGLQGFEVGFFVILCSILTIFVLKDVDIKDKKIYIPTIFVTFVIFAFAIPNTMNIDVFNLHNGAQLDSYHRFISTLGNVNWVVGYLSLLSPLFICLFIKEEDSFKNILYFLMCSVLIFNILVIDSDGIILGLGFASFFLISFLFDNLRYIKKLSYILILTTAEILLVKYLPIFNDYYLLVGGYSKYIYENITIILVSIISIILFIFSSKCKVEKYIKIKSYLIKSIYIVMILAVVLILFEAIKSGDAEWGTGRLIIWKESFRQFNRYTPFMKIFGIGPELLTNVYARLTTYENALYNSSHSEPIQMLMSMGISGLLAWITCWVGVFVLYFKTKKNNQYAYIGIFSGLFAYFGQSFVNSATLVNVCILTMFIIQILNISSKKSLVPLKKNRNH